MLLSIKVIYQTCSSVGHTYHNVRGEEALSILVRIVMSIVK